MDLTEQLRALLADRYRIEREIGRGGNAVVYLARDLKHDRDVAVKALRPELTRSVGADRFHREVEITAQFRHLHILPLFDSGVTDGLLYYVMPYVEGGSLRALIHRSGALPIPDVTRITAQIADALAYAHAHGVVHRDVKPENVMFVNGDAVLADFGIAHAYSEAGGGQLTSQGLAIGTPEYMSPEQASGERTIDGRSDVYALGCVVYEMLSGGPPFTGPTTQAVLAKHCLEPPPPIEIVRPGIPRGMKRALERALAKVPADRFATAGAFAEALIEGEQSTPVVGGEGERRGLNWLYRTHPVVTTMVLLAVTVLGGIGIRVAIRASGEVPPILDDRRIVVFPLSATVPGEEWAVRGWEAALAIEEALERTEPLKWIDGWGLLADSVRAEPRLLSRGEANRIARAVGARFHITGVIRGADSASSVTLWLNDAAADSVVAPVTRAGVGQGLALLAIGAMERLLGRLLEPGRAVDLTPFTQRTQQAIALTLQGDRAYRQADFLGALAFYKRAVAEDSLSALSAVKGAQAASWCARIEEDGRPLLEVAMRADSLLPPKYRAYVRGLNAHFLGDADVAIDGLREALESDPDWNEVWMALGETYYSLLPSVTNADSLAEYAYRRAVVADSLFAPPFVRLAQIMARRGDLDSTRTLASRFYRIGTDSTHARELRFLVGCLERGPAAMADAKLGDSVAVTLAAMQLSTGGARIDCAEAGFRHMLGVTGLPVAHRQALVLGLSGVLMVQGRYAELEAFLDSTVAAGYRGALFLYLYNELLGAPPSQGALAAEELSRNLAGGLYDRAQPGNRWALGVWQLNRGNGELAADVAMSMDRVADSTGSAVDRLFADALSAHVAIAQGDTAEAMRRFDRLHARFPERALVWQPVYTLAPSRLLQAEVLLARGRFAEADSMSAMLDGPPLLATLAALPRALTLRAAIARSAGLEGRAVQFEDRIRRLRN